MATNAWNTILIDIVQFLPNLTAALIIFLVGIWAGVWAGNRVKALLARHNKAANIQILFGNVTRWAIIALALTMALEQVGFNITAFLTGLGALSFALGFAVQDVSKNMIAGVLLMLQQPFDIGEAVEVSGYAGKVEEIALRATAIRTFDGRLVYLPNADVYTSPIVNFSRSGGRRIEVTVGVAYGTDLAKAQEVALQAVKQIAGVKEDPVPVAVFHTFNDSSVDMTVYFWVEPSINLFQAKDEAVRAIHDSFNTNGIEIPFPIRTVYLESEQGQSEQAN